MIRMGQNLKNFQSHVLGIPSVTHYWALHIARSSLTRDPDPAGGTPGHPRAGLLTTVFPCFFSDCALLGNNGVGGEAS